jgi:hypothetical protein
MTVEANMTAPTDAPNGDYSHWSELEVERMINGLLAEVERLRRELAGRVNEIAQLVSDLEEATAKRDQLTAELATAHAVLLDTLDWDDGEASLTQCAGELRERLAALTECLDRSREETRKLTAELAKYRGDDRHIIDLREDGWTIQHPLACRPNLFACLVNKAAGEDLTGPPVEIGQFYCDVADGRLTILDRVPAPFAVAGGPDQSS